MRNYSATEVRNFVRRACNEVNIIFPSDFGPPQLLQAPGCLLAAFAPHVLTLTRIDGVMVPSRAIGRGMTPEAALGRLFTEFADVSRYDAVYLLNPADRAKDAAFQHYIRPYRTITFMKCRDRYPDISAMFP